MDDSSRAGTAGVPGTGSDEQPQTPLTRALATVRTLRRRIEELETQGPGGSRAPIAVVGIGLRLPGGIDTLDGYWTALMAGRDCVRPMPGERMGPFAAEWAQLPRRGGFLDDVLGFDAAFFGISPREARHLDPQHRLLLEVTWEALENAALPADRLAGTRTGTYLGITMQDYRDWLAAADEPDLYWATGSGLSFAAGRVAYTLGLTGPAVAVDTACSSSLVAVHLAMRALRDGECEVALAAGVNLIMSPRSTRLVQQTRALAPDGLCKTFDARANGFTRGEGCVTVVLKRLEDARRDGDRVHAVLHGSAINQDGRSGGFTAPNVLSQMALVETALADAGLGPADIGYVEAHGTGTSLGDPIEMEALAGALGRRNGGAVLPVGAVKTNLGHLESAAGLAGLVKTVLALRHRRVPPLVHFRTLNPRIDLSGTGMTVPAEPLDWSPESGRYAGVSAFGMSGTNAHVVLGAADADERPQDDAPVAVGGFGMSARTPTALRALAARYAEHVATLDPADYPAFAYTATAGRTRHDVHVRITASDPASAARALSAVASGQPPGTGGSDDRDTAAGSGAAEQLPRRVVDLPAYPWQRRPYAPESTGSTAAVPAEVPGGAPGARDQVALLMAHALGFEDPAEVPAGTDFFDLGLDSVTAADVAARLSAVLDTTVGVTDVYDHPTVTGLADHLLGRADASPPDDTPLRPTPCLIPLSAPDPRSLERLTADWTRRLENAGDEDLPRLAARAAGQEPTGYPYRRAPLGTTRAELLAALRTAWPPTAAPRHAPRVAFLFSGQGSQYFGMGRELYETERVFREVFDRCDRLLSPYLGVSVADLLYDGDDRTAVNETWATQPCLVTLELALAALWESWGVAPVAMLGHSVGELAAAMHTGAVSLPAGLSLVARRARLMQETEPGAMLAVTADEERAAAWAAEAGLDVAAVNGPEAVVVSGPARAVAELAGRLREQGVQARQLTTSRAFHSRLLEPALDTFADALAPVRFREPDVPVVSNLTGRCVEPGEYDAEYWCRHARQPVRFLDGLRRLGALGIDACLEIGPGRTLVTFAEQAGPAPAAVAVPSLRRGSDPRTTLLDAVRTLYLAGQEFSWPRIQPAPDPAVHSTAGAA